MVVTIIERPLRSVFLLERDQDIPGEEPDKTTIKPNYDNVQWRH